MTMQRCVKLLLTCIKDSVHTQKSQNTERCGHVKTVALKKKRGKLTGHANLLPLTKGHHWSQNGAGAQGVYRK